MNGWMNEWIRLSNQTWGGIIFSITDSVEQYKGKRFLWPPFQSPMLHSSIATFNFLSISWSSLEKSGWEKKGKKFILIFSSENKSQQATFFHSRKMMILFSVCLFSFFFFLLLFLATPLSCPLSLCCPTGWDSERVQTQSNSQQRSDFSLHMAPGLGHKSPSIHIFQAGAGFCPAGARRLERAAIRPAPPGVRSQGQLNVWPLRPFSWCSLAMSQPPPCSAPCPHAPMPRASHHNRPHQTAFSSSPKNRDGSGEKKRSPTRVCNSIRCSQVDLPA